MLRLFRYSLTGQMIIAVCLGIFTGLLLGDICQIFLPLEKAYVMILKITTIPYLITAIAYGVGRLIPSLVKEILKKGLILIALAWVINISVIYLAVYLFPQSTNGMIRSVYSDIPPTKINFFELLIPDNIFLSLTQNVIPSVVVFSLLIGLALICLQEKQVILSLLSNLFDSFTLITKWISRITPIGTFLVIADRVGTIQAVTVKQLVTYLIIYVLCILLLIFWIFPRLVGMLTSISATRWLKDLSPVLLLAFTTNVVIVTLPFMVELIKKELDRYYCKNLQLQEEIQGVISITFNLPLGALLISIFVFFISISYHLHLSLIHQAQLFLLTFLTGLGSVGLGSWVNALNFILNSLNLPLAAIESYMTIAPFTAGLQATVSVMEISTLSLLIVLACHKFLQWRWKEIILKGTVTLLPIFLLLTCFKSWVKLPSISRPVESIYDFSITDCVESKVFTSEDPLPPPRTGDVFQRVTESKVLRIGYSPNSPPFSFFGNHGELVGYDIALAHLLAKDLECNLEFIPMQFPRFTEELNEGLYDIAASGLSITERRIKEACFTLPYMESQVVFIMKKQVKDRYTSIEKVLGNSELLFIVYRGSAYEDLLQKLSIPPSRYKIIDRYEEYLQKYPDDILIRGEPQAISWVLNFPEFTIVFPSPVIGRENLAYGLAYRGGSIFCYLNQWLSLKKMEAITQQQYEKWVFGKKDHSSDLKERRWSIIKNIFGWGH